VATFLVRKLGRDAEARAEFERAAAMAQNARERELLLSRAAACSGPRTITDRAPANMALVRSQRVPGGVVHELPEDLRKALVANPVALAAWKDITPLARNEFICWVEDAKQQVTRERRIRRTQEELQEGQRRPCCWPGCSHRERTGK
jgi:hypothetical protein